MISFPVPEFAAPKYDGTLFAALKVVDDRNPIIIERDPIPPMNRVMFFQETQSYAGWLHSRVSGGPDLRYNGLYGGGGVCWIEFQKLFDWLQRAAAVGDVFELEQPSAFPVMATTCYRRGEAKEAAILSAVPDWGARPIYFRGEFEAFSKAIEHLMDLRSKIAAGTATAVSIG